MSKGRNPAEAVEYPDFESRPINRKGRIAVMSRSSTGAVGAVVATSANLPGGVDPRRVEDVPPDIAAAVEVVIDGGELPGTPSTVVDLTGPEPRVLREGAVPAADVLERLRGLTDR